MNKYIVDRRYLGTFRRNIKSALSEHLRYSYRSCKGRFTAVIRSCQYKNTTAIVHTTVILLHGAIIHADIACTHLIGKCSVVQLFIVRSALVHRQYDRSAHRKSHTPHTADRIRRSYVEIYLLFKCDKKIYACVIISP